MPNKYANKKEWKVPKQKYKLSNWSEYSDALRRRGEIDVWLSEEAISLWYEKDRVVYRKKKGPISQVSEILMPRYNQQTEIHQVNIAQFTTI